MNSSRAMLAVFMVPVMALSGCATAIRSVWPDEAPPRTVQVAYRPVPAGLRIDVSLPPPPATPGRPDLKDWIGGGLDVAIGLNLPLLLLPFSDMGSAYLAAGAIAAAAVGVDYVLGATLGTGRADRSQGTWRAQVSYPAALAPVGVALAETDGAAAGRAFTGVAPLEAQVRIRPLTVAVLDPDGHVMRQEMAQFPAAAWGTAEQAALPAVGEPQAQVDVDQLPPAGTGKVADCRGAHGTVGGRERLSVRVEAPGESSRSPESRFSVRPWARRRVISGRTGGNRRRCG